jgi:hypothetical protein
MKLIMDSRKPMLQAMIPGSVALDSVVYSKGCRGTNRLVDVGKGRHLRVDHGKD